MALSALNTTVRKLFCTMWQVLWSKEEPVTVITWRTGEFVTHVT
jgi:hypothetical protein